MDPELRQFAVSLLTQEGALIQEQDQDQEQGPGDGFEVVLPPSLFPLGGGSDYLRVGDLPGETPLIYGAPFLEKAIEWACRDRILLARQWRPPTIKRDGFESLVPDTFTWQNASGRVTGCEEVETAYWVFHLFYTAKSDEVQRGFRPAVLHETALSSPPGFLDRSVGLEWVEPSKTEIPLPDEKIKPLLRQLERIAFREIRSSLSGFIASRERRLERDLRQLDEYYRTQEREMRKYLERAGLEEKARRVREEKIARLPLEREAKEVDLIHKYGLRVEIDCRTLLRLVTRAVRVTFELRRRKERRPLSLFWNPLTKRLDPLVCEGCGENIYHVTVCDTPHLLCRSCGTQCPLCDRNDAAGSRGAS